MDILLWIEEWYEEQCDGDWEHEYGVHISNIDNPGWSVVINLERTLLSDKNFEKVNLDVNDQNWVMCFIEDGNFKGYGDPSKLITILTYFKDFAVSEQLL